MAMINSFSDASNLTIQLALISSRWVGMTAGQWLTWGIASPFMLIDWALVNATKKCCDVSEDYELRSYDLTIRAANTVTYFRSEEDKVIYRGGFFSKYPLGVVAEVTGTVVNATLSVSTFMAVAAVGFSLIAAAATAATAVVLGLAAMASLIWAVRACCVGPAQACSDFGCK